MARTYEKRRTLKRRLSRTYAPAKRRRFNTGRVRRRPSAYRKRGNYYGKSMVAAPYRSSKYIYPNPVIKATSHKSEFYATGYSSTATANNPLYIHLRAFNHANFFKTNWATSNFYADHDAYELGFPTGYRKLFHKGVKVNLRFTNKNENNITVRVTVVRTRHNKAYVDMNHDVHRPQNTRHFHIVKQMKFTMDTGDFTPVSLGGTTTGVQSNANNMVTRDIYLPINKWMFTTSGKPSAFSSDFDPENTKDDLVMIIDTDDETYVDGQWVEIEANACQYWKTVNDAET